VNMVKMRYGEKVILQYFVDFTLVVVPLFNKKIKVSSMCVGVILLGD